MNSDELVKSELLCFLQQKSKIMTFDDLVSVTVCTHFYNSDEVRLTAAAVYNYVDQRPPAFEGSDKDRKTVADMLNIESKRFDTYIWCN